MSTRSTSLHGRYDRLSAHEESPTVYNVSHLVTRYNAVTILYPEEAPLEEVYQNAMNCFAVKAKQDCAEVAYHVSHR
jgi:hypothetical protein